MSVVKSGIHGNGQHSTISNVLKAHMAWGGKNTRYLEYSGTIRIGPLASLMNLPFERFHHTIRLSPNS